MLGMVGLGAGHPYCLLSADFQERRPSGGGESGEPDPEGDRQLWALWTRHSKQQNLWRCEVREKANSCGS